MKKKLVELNPPKSTRKKDCITVQYLESEILVLNFYKDRTLLARHCFNTSTSEYATLQQDGWSQTPIENLFGCGDRWGCYYGHYIRSDLIKKVNMDKADWDLIMRLVPSEHCSDPINAISDAESDRRWKQNIQRESNKEKKIKALMDTVPEIPEDIMSWAYKQAIDRHFALKEPVSKKFFCSACLEEFDVKGFKNHDITECPHCGQTIEILTRKKDNNQVIPITLIQPIDEEKSIARHFRAFVEIRPGRGTEADLIEESRMFLFKSNETLKPKKGIDIFYNAYMDWQRTNPQSRRWYPAYLYDGGIEEALKDTDYEQWSNIFKLMSAAGYRVNYNALMAWQEYGNVELTEMLFKGRFYKLLREKAECVSYWGFKAYGPLKVDYGYEIEDIFEISDKQRINRIRDRDGGIDMLRWMQWSERHKTKISDKTLDWLLKNKLESEDMAWIKCRFSLEQAMNYIERQRKESYKGMSAKQVVSQYEDYMRMAEKLHKDTTDIMIYKPRDLKKYHDMYVLEIERRSAEIKAEEYSAKYPEAESVLGQIKEKFEFRGEKYFIKVPEKIVDVVTEGNYLHHCVGSTDRYFDRIKCHETYICFLRKVENPEEPFYTIEVEPGGTIRQHRGMYDEEPDLDTVKPFLKQWQKEIKKRMKDEDHELAAVSKIKREENIAELKAKGNTRVLDGLIEDFMEAI